MSDIGQATSTSWKDAVIRLARTIEAAASDEPGILGRGDVSAMRRDMPFPPAAFWRLTAHHSVPMQGEASERRWEIVVRGMSIMAPHVHQAGLSFGRAALDAGFSNPDRPGRMERLLQADEDTLPGLVLSACRFMRAKAAPFDWRTLAPLVLFSNDMSRRDIAASFYRAGTPAVEA